jgi:hypothetical protein
MNTSSSDHEMTTCIIHTSIERNAHAHSILEKNEPEQKRVLGMCNYACAYSSDVYTNTSQHRKPWLCMRKYSYLQVQFSQAAVPYQHFLNMPCTLRPYEIHGEIQYG